MFRFMYVFLLLSFFADCSVFTMQKNVDPQNSESQLQNLTLTALETEIITDKKRIKEIVTLINTATASELENQIISKHINPNTIINFGYSDSLLARACRANKLELVALLVKHNAHLDYSNKYGETPLFISTITEKNSEITKLLIESGADVFQSHKILTKTCENPTNVFFWACYNRFTSYVTMKDQNNGSRYLNETDEAKILSLFIDPKILLAHKKNVDRCLNNEIKNKFFVFLMCFKKCNLQRFIPKPIVLEIFYLFAREEIQPQDVKNNIEIEQQTWNNDNKMITYKAEYLIN